MGQRTASAVTTEAGAAGVVSTTLNTGCGPVEYVSWGEGPAVLAIHGAMGGYDQSALLAETIGEPRYRYLAVSRPGYLGTPLTSGHTPEQQADLLAAMLDTLGIGRAALMAVSGGGPAALQFAIRHADRCWGLVLVSTCGGRIEQRVPMAFSVITWLARWPWVVDALRRRTTRDPEGAARRSIADPVVCARTLQDPEAGPLLRALQLSTYDRMARRLPGTRNDIEVTRSTTYPLERVGVPTLVVHGTSDRLVPFDEHGKVLATRIPGAELLAIEGGEHVAIFTHRREVRARVTGFLRAHVPAAADRPVAQ
jgi:pimeloyl-ACP methyl ester carboxylesterase